jgi:homoserine O-succinyltransferase
VTAPSTSVASKLGAPNRAGSRSPPTLRRQKLEIGLVNNMPDAAVAMAERQFCELLRTSAAEFDVRVQLFRLPCVPRSAFALSSMSGRYADAASVREAGLDAVIVTGAAPRAADLTGEPYWAEFERLVGDIAAARLPCLWSCLAAHAAVLALDGVVRRRLGAKRTGVFDWRRVGDVPALPSLPVRGLTPHSRYNDLAADDLVAKGYDILSWSPQAGVDMFAKRCGGVFLFVQGHPEYEADTLLREYRRDLACWIDGAGPPPPTPTNYFPPALERRLAYRTVGPGRGAVARSASALAGLLEDFSATAPWDSTAAAIFRNFACLVAREKQQRFGHSPPAMAIGA